MRKVRKLRAWFKWYAAVCLAGGGGEVLGIHGAPYCKRGDVKFQYCKAVKGFRRFLRRLLPNMLSCCNNSLNQGFRLIRVRTYVAGEVDDYCQWVVTDEIEGGACTK